MIPMFVIVSPISNLVEIERERNFKDSRLNVKSATANNLLRERKSEWEREKIEIIHFKKNF